MSLADRCDFMLIETRLRIGITTVGMLLSIVAGNFAQSSSASEPGCALVDKNHRAQFIWYEGRSGSSSEIKLRLRNNTDCAIIIQTDDVSPTQPKRVANGGMRTATVTGPESGVRLRLHYLVQDRRR